MADWDSYGDTDPNNVADGGADQDTSAGDGLPGYPVDGYPARRAGVFGSGDGLLGMTQEASAGVAQATPQVSAPQTSAIDWDFIHQREAAGAPNLSLYVPLNNKHQVVDRSGPTVGYGFDLGQYSPSDLQHLGLSPSLVATLTPYAQMQGNAAQTYVKARPLTLAASDVDAIDQAAQNKTAGDIAAKFDAASQVGPFAGLPSNTQTAVADLYHQYGTSDPAGSAPEYWQQITQGDWQGAYDNLRDFHDKYGSRRRLEAGLLKHDMDAGILPARSTR